MTILGARRVRILDAHFRFAGRTGLGTYPTTGTGAIASLCGCAQRAQTVRSLTANEQTEE